MTMFKGKEKSATAYVLINCDGGSEKALIEQIKHINGVKEVHGIF